MRIGSLFSGIGGLELGLEWAGVGTTVWQVEKDRYCRGVLEKHWPGVPRFDDVCTVGDRNLQYTDVICGGFPCQDISYAGKGEGLTGARSGLWYEFVRVVREMGPEYVVVENVRALLTRGIDQVLGTLADLGYDAEWHMLSAAQVGAPHRRERIFLIATRRDTDRTGEPTRVVDAETSGLPCDVANAEHGRLSERRGAAALGYGCEGRSGVLRHVVAGRVEQEATVVADAGRDGREPQRTAGPMGTATTGREGAAKEREWVRDTVGDSGSEMAHTNESRSQGRGERGERPGERTLGSGRRPDPGHWLSEPDVGRVAHGVPARTHRLRALGNAVVPQCAEVIGRRLLAIHQERYG